MESHNPFIFFSHHQPVMIYSNPEDCEVNMIQHPEKNTCGPQASWASWLLRGFLQMVELLRLP